MTTKNMKPTTLAIDIGYGNTKLVFGFESGSWSELCFKSTAPRSLVNAAGLSGGLSASLDRVSIPLAGAEYLVGPEAHISGGGAILGTDFVSRPEYLALLRGAIFYMMKKSGAMIRHLDVLVLGLPVSNWQSRKDELATLGKGPHRIPVPQALHAIHGDTMDVTVGKVIVLPQPMGALHYSTFITPANQKMDAAIHMVIDPGYNTFDWFTSAGLRPDLQRSGSLQGGVSQLLKLVSNAAGAKLGVGSLNLGEVEKGLSEGVMNAHGKRMDMVEFRPLMQAAAAQVVDRFVNSIDMSLGVNVIHLAGGGAGFYIDALRQAFSGYDIKMESASVMSNARGFFLVGRAVAGMM